MIPAGTDVLVTWGGGAVAAQTNHDENWSADERETSTKQSGDYKESKSARKSGDLSLTFLFDNNATLGFLELFEDWKAGNIKELKVSTQNAGDYELACDAWINSLSRSYPDQDNQECSADFTFTGEPNYNEIT